MATLVPVTRTLPSPGILRAVACASAVLAFQARLPADPPAPAPQVFFDDFSYAGPDELEAHGWTVRTKAGWPGVENALWKREGVSFPADPDRPGKRVLRMTSSTDGAGGHTVQTQICQQRKFKEGTYAARVRFSDAPVSGPAGDGVVESCYTLSPLVAPMDPKYSECDFEYLPVGGWGEKGPTLFVTTWRTYSPEPNWKKDNTYNTVPGREGGWHVLVLQVAGGHVRYFLDGTQIADHGGRYYPRDTMSFNFNLWFIRDMALPSRELRTYQEDIDWVYFEKDSKLSPGEVGQRVEALHRAGIPRQDTVESMGLPCPCDS
jgi:hypothetical protein